MAVFVNAATILYFQFKKKIKRSCFNVLKNETIQMLKQLDWINQADPFELKIIKKN